VLYLRRLCLYRFLLLGLALAGPARADLFVLSQFSEEVLAYSAADGSFQGAFATTISEGFRNPAGIALRPSDGVLYVSSTSTGEIWSYTTATGEPVLPAVATGLFAPFGLDFDAEGAFLYFADASTAEQEKTDAVKRLDLASGVVTTVGSNGQADFLGVTVNGSDVFASDVALDRILRFPVSGGAATVVASTGLLEPGAILFPTSTQMLVADTGNDRVVEYLESGGSWIFNREVLGASEGLLQPQGLALAPDGRVSVSARQSGDVVLVDLVTRAVAPLVAPGAGGLSDPADLAWSGTTLLVAGPSDNAVFYFDGAGQPTGVRAEGRSAALDAGIDLSPDGKRLFVASIGSNDVIEFDVASGARVHIFNQACPNFPFPFDVALGSDARLYISCILNSSIERFDATTGVSLGSFVIGGAGGLVSPRNLTFGPNGNLFVSNGSNAILEFDGVTGAAIVPGPFVDANANGGGPLDPFGLRFHQGTLYVASLSHDEVMAFDAASGAFLSVFVPSGSGGLAGPRALDFGPDGDLYVSSENDDAVRRYDGETGAFVEIFVPSGSGGLDSPFDLAFEPAPDVPLLGPASRVLLSSILLASARRSLRGRHERGEKST
jgi:DNA-binding beta-propeller fold protein YncE